MATIIDKICLYVFFTYRSGCNRCSRTCTSANSKARKLPTPSSPRKSAKRAGRGGGGGRPCSYNIRKTSSVQWYWYLLTAKLIVTLNTRFEYRYQIDWGPAARRRVMAKFYRNSIVSILDISIFLRFRNRPYFRSAHAYWNTAYSYKKLVLLTLLRLLYIIYSQLAI